MRGPNDNTPAAGTASAQLQQHMRGLPVLAKELMAGGVAGGLSKTSVAPLERVKILFQTGQMRGTGVGSTLVHIYQNEGTLGFFKGNGASVLRIVPYAALNFAAYERLRELLVDGLLPASSHDQPDGLKVPPWLDLLAGSAAGAASTFVTYPLDFVRTRLAYQTRGPRTPASSPSSASPSPPSAHPPDGPRSSSIPSSSKYQASAGSGSSTSRGLGPTLAGILPYAGLKFYVYQSLKQQYAKADDFAHFRLHRDAEGPDFRSQEEHHSPHRLPVLISMSFGAVAGLAAQTVTFPLDVVRRQMQVQGLHQQAQSHGQPAIRSTLHGLANIVRQHGWAGLFRGLSINYMKVAPTTAIGFAVYDGMKGYLDLPRHM
ncbi:hypothetical protein WJX74_002197 [Apatococcus lobatus]|uniref:Mitochondrial carrier protein n=1 Tax=Apatococcus lobatus TaxID=904363 RepID=A0AAW1QW20_9CHLO